MTREGGLYKDNGKLLNALFRLAKQMDYKKSWVTFEFERQSYKPTLKEFQLLGDQMGYKSGWADIKFKEYYEK